tara:strand:+ start:1495 stop:1917 length:423 start_codon:yes stop_codon:yes gene_type:complete
MIYDEISLHLSEAGSLDRAASPIGLYLAWCANHQLVSQELIELKTPAFTGLLLREITGSEVLIVGCYGILESRWLNRRGNNFTLEYYGQYISDFAEIFEEDVYDVEDNWANYDRIAPLLTEKLFGFRREKTAKKWWKIWR